MESQKKIIREALKKMNELRSDHVSEENVDTYLAHFFKLNSIQIEHINRKQIKNTRLLLFYSLMVVFLRWRGVGFAQLGEWCSSLVLFLVFLVL